MDMTKVGGPVSVVKVCMSENRVLVSGRSPIGCEGFVQIWHPKSTPYYFSIPIILSVTHIDIDRDIDRDIDLDIDIYIYIELNI